MEKKNMFLLIAMLVLFLIGMYAFFKLSTTLGFIILGLLVISLSILILINKYEQKVEQKRYNEMTPEQRKKYDEEKAKREEAEIKIQEIKNRANKVGKLLEAILQTTIGTYEPNGKPAILWIKEDRLAYVSERTTEFIELCSIPFKNLLDIKIHTEEELRSIVSIGYASTAIKDIDCYIIVKYYDELTKKEQGAIFSVGGSELSQKFVNKVLVERNRYIVSKNNA